MFLARAHSRLLRPSLYLSRHSYTTNTTSKESGYTGPQSLDHHDLPSFLEYAARIGLDAGSTTYVGTHYEYTVRASLSHLGMHLTRIGGKSDCGIDLLGTWPLPSAPLPLKVLIQCKAFARKIDPSQARELEGAFVGAPPGWRGPGVLGLLVSMKPTTKGVREALGRSRWPMGYVLCQADGKITQMLWNRRAEEEGLRGIGVDIRYSSRDHSEKRMVLTWKGDIL